MRRVLPPFQPNERSAWSQDLNTDTTTENKEDKLVLGVCVFLVLAVLAVFGQTAGFMFLNFDDGMYVYENPVVQQGLRWPGVAWAFRYAAIGHWHPLTWLSHMADCQLFGLWPGGPHLVNVALHAGSSVLLFLLLRTMTGTLWRSALVAAVFAVHPLRAESVAWVAERKDVLSGLFFMLTLWAYVRYARQPSRGKFAIVVLLYALGLLSKNMLVTLPLVLLLLDWWPLRRMNPPLADGEKGVRGQWAVLVWSLVKEKLPLFVLAAGSCVATILAPEKVASFGHVSTWQRLGGAFVCYCFYLRDIVFPTGLAIPYLFPPHGFPLWEVILAGTALLGISVAVAAGRRRRPYLVVGWLWFLGMLFPVIGLVQISFYTHADRYTYLPSIGLTMAITWALADWTEAWKHGRVAAGGMMAVVVGTLIACAHHQTSYWRDSETLWTRTLAATSGNYVACYNLGVIRLMKGRPDDAMTDFRKALEFNPDYAPALNNLGGNFMAKDDLRDAIPLLRRAVAADPSYEIASCNLGQALAQIGQLPEAIVCYRQALELKPDYAEAHYGLGAAFFAQHQWEEAIRQLRKALDLKPGFPEASFCLGRALLRKGDFDGAMDFLEANAKAGLYPTDQWLDLGNDFLQKSYFEDAVLCFQREAAIHPGSADAGASLGLAFYENGQPREAVEAWQKTLEIKPDLMVIRNGLAWLLATTPDASLRNGTKAIALAEAASQASANADPVVLHTLAAAYAEAGRFADATSTARRARELAATQKNENLAAQLETEMKQYEADKPTREAPRRVESVKPEN